MRTNIVIDDKLMSDALKATGLPTKKGSSMKDLTQAQCDRIAKKLNPHSRKRHGSKTFEEILYG